MITHYLTIHLLSVKIATIKKRNDRKMEKIKSDQEKVLKEILGKKWQTENRRAASPPKRQTGRKECLKQYPAIET